MVTVGGRERTLPGSLLCPTQDMVQRTAKAESQAHSKFTISTSDRFGDAPLPKPTRVPARFGGPAPTYSTLGYNNHPKFANAFGTVNTAVDKWEHSNPSRRTVRRTPHPDAYMDDLGPARYTPQRIHKSPSFSIVGRDYMPDGDKPHDLMYNVDGASRATSQTRSPGRFSFSSEPRMASIPIASQERVNRVNDIKAKAAKGNRLSDEERRELQADNRGEREDGSISYMNFNPPSSFGSSTKKASQSASFAFDSLKASGRFEQEDLTSEVKPLEARRRRVASSNPAPPHGGKLGVAFRNEPPTSPGPGYYAYNGSFDGTGKLKVSKSAPAFTITGKVPWTTLVGKNMQSPDAYTYF